ncbi:hypothetical protein [Nonomuraea sp. NPDC050540]|uniref:hypothetical protein n=1 Tax=Nonomuraea sp. NPDC050540 TaxID=3364367 RepID=UPI0037881BA2
MTGKVGFLGLWFLAGFPLELGAELRQSKLSQAIGYRGLIAVFLGREMFPGNVLFVDASGDGPFPAGVIADEAGAGDGKSARSRERGELVRPGPDEVPAVCDETPYLIVDELFLRGQLLQHVDQWVEIRGRAVLSFDQLLLQDGPQPERFVRELEELKTHP